MYEEVKGITISGFHQLNIEALTNAINAEIERLAEGAACMDEHIVIIEVSYAVNLYSAILTYGITKPKSVAD